MSEYSIQDDVIGAFRISLTHEVALTFRIIIFDSTWWVCAKDLDDIANAFVVRLDAQSWNSGYRFLRPNYRDMLLGQSGRACISAKNLRTEHQKPVIDPAFSPGTTVFYRKDLLAVYFSALPRGIRTAICDALIGAVDEADWSKVMTASYTCLSMVYDDYLLRLGEDKCVAAAAGKRPKRTIDPQTTRAGPEFEESSRALSLLLDQNQRLIAEVSRIADRLDRLAFKVVLDAPNAERAGESDQRTKAAEKRNAELEDEIRKLKKHIRKTADVNYAAFKAHGGME